MNQQAQDKIRQIKSFIFDIELNSLLILQGWRKTSHIILDISRHSRGYTKINVIFSEWHFSKKSNPTQIELIRNSCLFGQVRFRINEIFNFFEKRRSAKTVFAHQKKCANFVTPGCKYGSDRFTNFYWTQFNLEKLKWCDPVRCALFSCVDRQKLK